MSYHRNQPGERGRLTEQFAQEPTGYHHSMGALARSAPPLNVAMPRAGVQPTVPMVGTRVVRRPRRLIVPRHPRQQPSPRPTRYRGLGPRIRPLRPGERLSVDGRPHLDPPPTVEQVPPNVPPPLVPPAPSAPPLPDDIDYSDPFGFESSAPEVDGGELLEAPAATSPATSSAKPFPWKTVGVVAAIGTALYLIGRK